MTCNVVLVINKWENLFTSCLQAEPIIIAGFIAGLVHVQLLESTLIVFTDYAPWLNHSHLCMHFEFWIHTAVC